MDGSWHTLGALRLATHDVTDVGCNIVSQRDHPQRRSVFFYTLHKCASTLFASYVLKNARGLRRVNYAGKFFRAKTQGEFTFADYGHVYGPLRVSSDWVPELYEKLTARVTSPDFVRDKIAIFLVRDPRDIIVSWYYSIAFSHGISPSPEIAELQHRMRGEAQTGGVDQFAIEFGEHMLRYFETIDRLAEAAQQSVVLRYEDMIDNWEKFVAGLTRYLEFDDEVLQQIYERSRPVAKEDDAAHRRSGKSGGYKTKLSPATIAQLNSKLGTMLRRFDYEIKPVEDAGVGCALTPSHP